jgi:hypothetical protein
MIRFSYYKNFMIVREMKVMRFEVIMPGKKFKSRSSRLWRGVVLWLDTNVSEVHAASMYTASEARWSRLKIGELFCSQLLHTRSRVSSVSIENMLRARRPRFDFRTGEWWNSLSATAFRPDLRPTSLRCNAYGALFPRGVKRLVTIHLHLVWRLRTRGAIHSLPQYVIYCYTYVLTFYTP